MSSCICDKVVPAAHLGAAEPLPVPTPAASPSAREFMELTDDGTNPELWHKAELILVGLSGMSKTPISRALAQAGIFVSNYPLVKGVAVPEALKAIPVEKVLALSIRADVLWSIRQDRAYKWGISSSDLFVDYEEIEEEVRWVKRIYRQHGWRLVNVTDRQPEDVATDIRQKVLQRL